MTVIVITCFLFVLVVDVVIDVVVDVVIVVCLQSCPFSSTFCRDPFLAFITLQFLSFPNVDMGRHQQRRRHADLTTAQFILDNHEQFS